MGKIESAMKARDYHIERVPEGGFIVWPITGDGWVRLPLFACTDIKEALNYIKKGFGE